MMSARRVKRTGKRTLFDVTAALARRLSGVRGANFSACADCGSLLSPVFVMVGDRGEVCGVACLPCETFWPVLLGVVVAEPIVKEIEL